MNRIILTLICLTVLGGAFGQTGNDTTRFRIGRLEFLVIGPDTIQENKDGTFEGKKRQKRANDDDLTYWSGFDIGVNVPLNGDFNNSFQSKHLQFDPAQSFVYSFNILEQRVKIIKDYFGIVTGLGFTNSRYGFKDNSVRLVANGDSTFAFSDTTLFTGFTKNQLRVNTLNVPLLLQINTSRYAANNFHITVGAIGGIRIGSNVKYRFDLEGGGDTKSKVKGRYNLNAFQVLGTVRIGYKDFGLFANYDLISLYEVDKSEKAYPFSFGASFHF